MMRTPQATSAEEPDGGNLHVRIWRGPGLRKWLRLLYHILHVPILPCHDTRHSGLVPVFVTRREYG